MLANPLLSKASMVCRSSVGYRSCVSICLHGWQGNLSIGCGADGKPCGTVKVDGVMAASDDLHVLLPGYSSEMGRVKRRNMTVMLTTPLALEATGVLQRHSLYGCASICPQHNSNICLCDSLNAEEGLNCLIIIDVDNHRGINAFVALQRLPRPAP